MTLCGNKVFEGIICKGSQHKIILDFGQALNLMGGVTKSGEDTDMEKMR